MHRTDTVDMGAIAGIESPGGPGKGAISNQMA